MQSLCALRGTAMTMPYKGTISCRLCGEVYEFEAPQSCASWYLQHTVKNHWREVLLLHNASDTTIADAIELARLKSWIIREANGTLKLSLKCKLYGSKTHRPCS